MSGMKASFTRTGHWNSKQCHEGYVVWCKREERDEGDDCAGMSELFRSVGAV